MIFRTILFFVLMYLLVKIISRLFLASSSNNGKENFINHTFNRFSQQQNRQSFDNRKKRKKASRFDEIEEAEFEDITDKNKQS